MMVETYLPGCIPAIGLLFICSLLRLVVFTRLPEFGGQTGAFPAKIIRGVAGLFRKVQNFPLIQS